MEAFIAITIGLSIFIILVSIYLIYTVIKIKKLKKQIQLHKDTTLSSKYVMSTILPLLLFIPSSAMIAIDFILFLILCVLVAFCVYFNDLYEKLNKEFIRLLEDEKNGKMEFRRDI